MLAIHLDGTFYCTRAAFAPWRRAGRRGREHVVDLRPRGLHRAPALLRGQGCRPRVHQVGGKELIVQGIRVNCVAPGHVGTSTLQGEINEERAAIAASTPPVGRRSGRDRGHGRLPRLRRRRLLRRRGAQPNGGLVTA